MPTTWRRRMRLGADFRGRARAGRPWDRETRRGPRWRANWLELTPLSDEGQPPFGPVSRFLAGSPGYIPFGRRHPSWRVLHRPATSSIVLRRSSERRPGNPPDPGRLSFLGDPPDYGRGDSRTVQSRASRVGGIVPPGSDYGQARCPPGLAILPHTAGRVFCFRRVGDSAGAPTHGARPSSAWIAPTGRGRLRHPRLGRRPPRRARARTPHLLPVRRTPRGRREPVLGTLIGSRPQPPGGAQEHPANRGLPHPQQRKDDGS